MRSTIPNTGQTYSKEKGKPREKEGKIPSKAATLERKGGSLLALWMKSSSTENKHDPFHSSQRSIVLWYLCNMLNCRQLSFYRLACRCSRPVVTACFAPLLMINGIVLMTCKKMIWTGKGKAMPMLFLRKIL